MTAAIIPFPIRWRKHSIAIASNGRVVEVWEAHFNERRANIVRGDDGVFRWRGYVPVRHRTPQRRQRYRPLTPIRESWSLFAAITAAEIIVPVW